MRRIGVRAVGGTTHTKPSTRAAGERDEQRTEHVQGQSNEQGGYIAGREDSGVQATTRPPENRPRRATSGVAASAIGGPSDETASLLLDISAWRRGSWQLARLRVHIASVRDGRNAYRVSRYGNHRFQPARFEIAEVSASAAPKSPVKGGSSSTSPVPSETRLNSPSSCVPGWSQVFPSPA